MLFEWTSYGLENCHWVKMIIEAWNGKEYVFMPVIHIYRFHCKLYPYNEIDAYSNNI